MTETQENSTSIQVTEILNVPAEHAFRVFTEQFDRIKPREHNLLEVPIARSVFEARAGGTVYDVGTDGGKCVWARVLVCEPPHRLVFTFDINPQWEVETDHNRTSEIEVRFIAEAAERTRVEFEHRHLDRHGDGWEDFTGLDAGNGWPLYLTRLRAAAEAPGAA